MRRATELARAELYSEELGIRLRDRQDREYFKWFLASLLFGGRISETIAKNTYRAFARHRLVTPKAILAAGWDYLVNPIMREGGYVRYDGRKSTQVLRDCATLVEEYDGSLKKLHDDSADSSDLEAKLLAFHGVGPVTVNVFLRELRPFWRRACPQPLPIVRELAKKHRIDLDALDPKTMRFVRIEAGLIRARHSIVPK
jgi:endonuclease III